MADPDSYLLPNLFDMDLAKINNGDIIGLAGYPFKTKNGQLSIRIEKLEILSFCKHIIPRELKDKVSLFMSTVYPLFLASL